MNTPFFPALRCRLAALGRQTLQSVRQATLVQLQEHLSDLIPPALLSAQEQGPNSRERVFTLRLSFECFVWQMLKPKTSCREVVRQVQALLRLSGRRPIAQGDSAYIQARQRLAMERLEEAVAATAQSADRRVGSGALLAGRPVKVVDGSTVQLPDTPQNQKRYPQPSSQKPGCGFPVLRFVTLMSLSSGAILRVMMDSLRGHDLRLFHRLWEFLKQGDIVLGDRAFGEYTTLAQLPQKGVDVIARLHHQRKVDFRKAQRLAKNEALLLWTKGCMQSHILSAKQWRQMSDQITVRIIRFNATIRGFRNRRVTLVTTLLDAKLYPAEQIIALYARRWSLELCLRDLKSTLGMEFLRCQSPRMAQKELLAYLIAHNLVRCLMAQAVAHYQVPLESISFKGSLDALRQYSSALAQARSQKMRRCLWEDLLLNLARDLIRSRPLRREPRAVKRRPKAYPLLNQPRRRFVEISHRGRYWKGRPRNYRGLN
jgi:hypothetical protein